MAEAHNDPCHSYYTKGLLDEAEKRRFRALEMKPNLREARGNLRNVLTCKRKPE
jgi:hypothetical protein